MNKKIRPIAIFLPQFYPTEENDEWWGMGFTEWTNVTKARPRFLGHYQPHLPADLGFYDLRLAEVKELQAKMAREYGISAFCYYHYWFNGRRILEKPMEDILKTGKPDLPFMFCWANENWTKGWSNKPDDILLQQDYSLEDDKNHIAYLLNVFKDPRYLRIDNKPVIAIYRSTLIPDVSATLKLWRDEAKKEGIELYICRFESYGVSGEEYLDAGFDAAIEFQPHAMNSNSYMKNRNILPRMINKLARRYLKQNLLPIILSYPSYVRFMCKQSQPTYKRYPCVMPSWDNAPRKKGFFLAFKGSTPTLYYKWLKSVVSNFVPYSKDENLLFINAWNEWAEGAHLEPDQKWGRAYLEMTKKVLQDENII